jgi:hypothetical protein
VEKVIRIDRVYLVAAAAARGFNDELTVILTSLDGVFGQLPDDHPALPLLFDLQAAAQRCVWKAGDLMEFSARRGVAPPPPPLKKLLA